MNVWSCGTKWWRKGNCTHMGGEHLRLHHVLSWLYNSLVTSPEASPQFLFFRFILIRIGCHKWFITWKMSAKVTCTTDCMSWWINPCDGNYRLCMSCSTHFLCTWSQSLNVFWGSNMITINLNQECENSMHMRKLLLLLSGYFPLQEILCFLITRKSP